MKKILIAFLGSSSYQETTYQIGDKQYVNQLSFIPIYKHLSPVDVAYVIGTKESKWEMLEDFHYQRVEIPYGRSESDFWEMFDILTNRINIKETEVIFDITHCFRAIPVFTAIYIRFLKYIEPTANFSHILYGSFEKDKPVTPIVDLAPILELLAWIDATISFIKHGELEGLSKRVKDANDKIWKQESTVKPQMLIKFSRRLEELSNMSRLTYIPLLSEASRDISELLNRPEFQDEMQRYVKPFSLLADSLIQYTSRFSKTSLWESHLEIAKWYLENKKPTQSLLVLRETILTSLCERDGCDPYDIKARGKRETELNEQRGKTKEPIIKLWQKITDARNRAGHALMKREYKEISVNKAAKEVGKLIKETKEILGGKIDRNKS